ncbi:TBC1 domain family member 12 isoform X2 [Spea bombifrons]|uniref:TBC1 domain family member 12 isoform X2 n=1 Tax=Spea bombifrons TaxID=233779 RepID=UPI002349DDF6|nr:TBC1 domain family member 12 isoform X2 [Spea bombifrons]
MVGPEDAGGQGAPVFYRCGEDREGLTEEEEGEEEAGRPDILHLYITGPGMRMTNGDLGYCPRGEAGELPGGTVEPAPLSVHTEEMKVPNGGLLPAGSCCKLSGEDEPPAQGCSCHRQCCSEDESAVSRLPHPSHPLKERVPPEFSPSDSAPSARTPPDGSPPSSSNSSPVSAHTVAGYFVSDEADRFRFLDVTLNSHNTYEVSRRQSAPDHLDDGLSLPQGSPGPQEQDGERPWRMGIADFFTRNFFSKRSKDVKASALSAPGWKLFGKVPPRENVQKDSKIIQQEYEARAGRTCKTSAQSTRRKKFEFEPLSTTALILEDRPANLPAKSALETLRHRQEYDEMVAEAKKREVKEAQRRKKQMKERFKQEENIASAMVIWNTEILPNWDVMRSTRRVRDLWWQGLPPSVRGKVWSLAVGNELNITPELYEIFLSRAKERWKSFSETGSENETEDTGVSVADREASLELIKLDISRTFPSLYIFQKGGPYHDLLHSVLGAYTCYRPDVGYVQGMSFIAAVLILNLEEADAFIAFANLLNKPCQLAFFRVDHSMMLKYFAAFEVFFEENLPKLFLHFNSYSLTPDLYLIDWIFTLYSKSLPLDLACRVWDVFCRDGEEFLFRTALGILRLYEDILLQMDFIHIAQFLTKLPEDITSEKLFSCIAAVQMQNSNKKWSQVFTSLTKDYKEG